MYLGQRIFNYVSRFHNRHKDYTESYKYPFPTVKQVARGLKVSMKDVIDEIDACGELPLMTTSYFTQQPQPISQHFVEIIS